MTQVESLLNDKMKVLIDCEIIVEKKTKFQKIKIIKTKDFGKVLLIDDIVQLSEKDEVIYHEAITHPVMAMHQNPKKILIIGGGDGGVIREVLKHPVKEIVLVEIDKEIINLVNKNMPIAKEVFNNKKLKIIYEDGKKFIEETKEKFDIIFLDLPDPEINDIKQSSASSELFTKEFYQKTKKTLKKNGKIVAQTGSPTIDYETTKAVYSTLKKVFKNILMYGTEIPSMFLFLSFCIFSDEKINKKDIIKNLKKRKIKSNAFTHKQLKDILEPNILTKEVTEKKGRIITQRTIDNLKNKK